MKEKRYKLRFFDFGKNLLQIYYQGNYDGDCYIVAISEIASEKAKICPKFESALMTLDEIYEFISKRKNLLGDQIRDCCGILLKEEDWEFVNFENSIVVRNIK